MRRRFAIGVGFGGSCVLTVLELFEELISAIEATRSSNFSCNENLCIQLLIAS